MSALLLRNAIGEDVEKIRLQRELRNKTGRLEAAQTQCEVLERNLSVVKTQNTRLLEEVEALNQRVKQVCVDRGIIMVECQRVCVGVGRHACVCSVVFVSVSWSNRPCSTVGPLTVNTIALPS